MPLLMGAHILIAVLCAIHVIRTGRQMYWLFILFAFPAIGSAVYVVAEILPAAAGSPTAHKAGAAARKALDPTREAREALHQLELTRTPGHLHRAGVALLETNKPAEALELMQEANNGAFAEDAMMMLGLARAQFANDHFDACIAQLERLREIHPNLRLPEGHLLYARCLEAGDRQDEALDTYAAVADYYPGAEARARWAMLLNQAGRNEEARVRWAEILNGAKHAPKFTRKAQRKWIEMARARV
jgi:hypothetical protein